MIQWIASSLSRKLAVTLVLGMAVASLLFLALFMALYRDSLERDRADMSAQVNHLLRVSLENAMLKRDLPGLRRIVQDLAEHPRIARVMILNPDGEVRFSSEPADLGRHFQVDQDSSCVACHLPDGTVLDKATLFLKDERNSGTQGEGAELLRSITPVLNKPPCQQCHGSIAEHPVNGVLLVDFQTSEIREHALVSAVVMSGAGILVVLLTVLGAGFAIRRLVLAPVGHLAEASQRLAGGHLEARVTVSGHDEIANLGHVFNDMADSLQQGLESVAAGRRSLQAIIDGVYDGIRVISEDHRILVANRRYAEIIGAEHQTLSGALCYRSSHAAHKPCPQSLVTCPLRECAEGRTSVVCNQTFVTADGRSLTVEVAAAPLTVLHEGRPVKAVVECIRDLSHEVHLSHGQRLSEMAQLATGVAHEVHNPLASARISLQTILRLIGQSAPDLAEIADYLQVLDGEIDRCVTVTGRLLRLAMPPGGQALPVGLRAAVEDVASLLKHEAIANHVTVETTLDPPDLRVMASESEVRMVILNVVQNAFHAMPEGGRLTIAASRSNDTVVLRISDTGVGISASRMDHIFEPFFSRRADRGSGTGLGLAICKGIVERYQGTIEADSIEGTGTTFTVTLPDADSPTDQEEV